MKRPNSKGYKAWTAVDEKQLLTMRNIGKSMPEVYAFFNTRKPANIRSKMVRMGISTSDRHIESMVWPDTEERIDIIGQNGNNGEHYGNKKQ